MDLYNCDITESKSEKPKISFYDMNIFYGFIFTITVGFLFFLNPNPYFKFQGFFYGSNYSFVYPFLLTIFFLLIISACVVASVIIWTKKKNRAKQQEQFSQILFCFYLIIFSILCIIYQLKNIISQLVNKNMPAKK